MSMQPGHETGGRCMAPDMYMEGRYGPNWKERDMALDQMHVEAEAVGAEAEADTEPADLETQLYPEYDQSEGSKFVWFVLLLYRTAQHANIYSNDRCFKSLQNST